ncbi:dynein light chain 2, cytoplasmic-like isoform X1 [Canna indica]|uniref:Dynein light chain n=1 Tax=Canna indica TaxID=4628 RepID=A0AAQ3K7B2_9LILI|nr:dynein light chain 2, cytoplasmic-like isoform X1 [Canna indica]
MMENRAIIAETDMLQTMQQDALHLAGKALDLLDVNEATEIARFIKKEFDQLHGPGWQCIVGTHFGSFVTHHSGCFIYFNIGSLAILLFRGASDTEVNKSHFISMEPSFCTHDWKSWCNLITLIELQIL